MRRILNRLLIGLWLLLPLIAPAATSAPASGEPTRAWTVCAYDAVPVRVVSDNALTGSEALGQPVSFFGPVAGLVAAKGVASGGDGPGAMTRLRYEGADYHGNVKVGGKNPAPINGQGALDTSLQVKPTSPRRVGIDYDSGNFNVFDQTSEGVFHGHTRTWSELTPEMQNTLRKAGMVTSKGKIQ